MKWRVITVYHGYSEPRGKIYLYYVYQIKFNI